MSCKHFQYKSILKALQACNVMQVFYAVDSKTLTTKGLFEKPLSNKTKIHYIFVQFIKQIKAKNNAPN